MPNKYLKAIIVLAILIGSNIYAGGPPPPKPVAPIDGGIFGLFIVAIAFAIKKIRDISK